MNEQYNKEVGERIRNLRKNRKISMAALGAKVNLHESTVNRYEQGKIKALEIDKMEDFAKALDSTPSYLMGWTEKIDKNIFSNNLSYLLLKRNKTIDDLSNLTNIPIDLLHRLESNVSEPTKDNLYRIANIFHIQPHELLRDRLYSFSNETQDTDNFFNIIEKELNYGIREIVEKTMKLNTDGVNKILEYINDLSDNSRYTK